VVKELIAGFPRHRRTEKVRPAITGPEVQGAASGFTIRVNISYDALHYIQFEEAVVFRFREGSARPDRRSEACQATGPGYLDRSRGLPCQRQRSTSGCHG